MQLFDFELGRKTAQRRRAFEIQVERQLPALMRLAYGFALQQADAEDLVHDTCVKALGAFENTQFDSEVRFNAWLRRILVNTYRDYYRREQRSPIRSPEYHASSEDDFNIVELAASTELTPLQSVENRNSSSAINNALAKLPPEVRVVSVLFLINQNSYQEIADIADCPIGTVMSRLSRGRRLLREQLAGHQPGDSVPASAAQGSEQHDAM